MIQPLDSKRHRQTQSSIGIPLLLLSFANIGFASEADDDDAPPKVRIQLSDIQDDISHELEFSDAMLQAACESRKGPQAR